MPTLLHRVGVYLRARLTGWRIPLAVVLFVFATSWTAMWLTEPASNPISRPDQYWWYFIVTAATVGYGDVYPETAAGRVVGVYVIVGGIVTLTILFTQLADHLQSLRSRRTRGLADVHLTGHVVLLGYAAGRTERILGELTAERRLRVALCAWDDDLASDPVPDDPDVLFVRGDLASADLLVRAGVPAARTVIVDSRDDNEALAVAVAVNHVAPEVHLVVALRDLTRREQLRYVHPGVQCVQWHMPYLLTEEAVDPGITQVYADLMSSGGHGNTYSVRLPDGPGTTFGACQTHFGQSFGATVLAVREHGELRVSPPWDTALAPGTTLYYVAAERIADVGSRPAG